MRLHSFSTRTISQEGNNHTRPLNEGGVSWRGFHDGSPCGAADAARSFLKLGVSTLAMVIAAPVFAQTTTIVPAPASPDTAAQQAQAEAEPGDIVVTGFRAALENAVAEKKNRDLVVESVSAEDIGKLPDASIAESIARLPGVTSQRVNGRSNAISIRGFAPDFSTTLLNGREQTSTGDNRAVEYDQYPRKSSTRS